MLETHVIDPYWRDTTWLSLVWPNIFPATTKIGWIWAGARAWGNWNGGTGRNWSSWTTWRWRWTWKRKRTSTCKWSWSQTSSWIGARWTFFWRLGSHWKGGCHQLAVICSRQFTRPAMVTRPAAYKTLGGSLNWKYSTKTSSKLFIENFHVFFVNVAGLMNLFHSICMDNSQDIPTWSFPCWLYGLPRCDPCTQGSHNVTNTPLASLLPLLPHGCGEVPSCS